MTRGSSDTALAGPVITRRDGLIDTLPKTKSDRWAGPFASADLPCNVLIPFDFTKSSENHRLFFIVKAADPAARAADQTDSTSLIGTEFDNMVRYANAVLSLVVVALLPAASTQAGVLAFNGQFSNDTPTPGPDPSCAPTQVLVSFNPGNSTAAGTSNFGNFGPSQSHCLTAGSPYTGNFNFAFDAGDALFGSTSGFLTPTATPGVLNSFVTYTALGGTGRFLGASGTVNGVGLLDRRPTRPLNALTLNGTLNLPAVPEPASWAMLITGFGLTGAVMRRRRTAAIAA